MRGGSPTLAAACSRTGRKLRMVGDEDCRTAVLGKTARTVGWEGDGEPARRGLVRHCKGDTRSNIYDLSTVIEPFLYRRFLGVLEWDKGRSPRHQRGTWRIPQHHGADVIREKD